jgi:hypothetical protein
MQNPPENNSNQNVSPDRLVAQAASSLAHTLRTNPYVPATTADEMLLELHHGFVDDRDCEHLLFLQARTLDAMFNRLVIRALKAPTTAGQEGGIDDDRLKLALTAQRQCRSAVNTMGLVRARTDEIFENELKRQKNARDINRF